MEAGFMSSNSFTKTTDFASTIKGRVQTYYYPMRKPNSAFRVPAPSSISCCQLGPNSSSEDDSKPSINADWRAFRARLVAGEEAYRRPLEPSPSVVSDAAAMYYPPQLTIGPEWAHTIHEPERGCLLIASEKLDGVNIFERTVILVLATRPVGPTGIILNRPSLMSIKEARSPIIDRAGTFSDSRLHFGGPLEEGLFLIGPKLGDDWVGKSGVFDEVMKGLYYGTKESVGCAAEMVKRNGVGVEDFRFFDGYCGWEKEQLKDEIKAGYWTVAACSPSVIEMASGKGIGLWEEVLGMLGRKRVQ